MPAHLSFRTIALVGTTLLALALGGSTELWAQGVIVLLAALLIFLFPPRVALGPVPLVVSLLLLVIAFSAFLPVHWGGLTGWRRHLAEMQAPLGDLRTPQPWLTLQACGLLLFGLTWIHYLFAQEWSPAEKSRALRLFAAGVAVLAGLMIFTYATSYHLPGWDQEENRGWFPNRNQTADVLAVCGTVIYALAFRELQKKKWTGVPWFAGFALVCIALVITYSRSGVVMLFGGIGLWHVGSLFQPRQGKHFLLGLAFLFLLLGLFLIFGGPTLERFLSTTQPDTGDYRLRIQQDAVQVSLQSPVLGAGLGNFEPVFTMMRESSADQNRTLHPESDWLWMAVEMGWLAPLLVLVGLKWWWNQCVPFSVKAGEAMRRAALVAVLVFLAHGFVDVSGHRLGSLMVGGLLAGLALSPAAPLIHSRAVPFLFRGLALLLGAMGAWWLVSSQSDVGPATSATLARLDARLTQAATDGKLASMGEDANAALAIAPLDWTYYFRRASAEAYRTGGADQATADFQIARTLEPNWIDLCLNEGEVWLSAGDADRCLDAWREALRRAGPRAAAFYERMLDLAQDDPDVHRDLRELARTQVDFLLRFFVVASPEEAQEEIDALLTRDPDLKTLTPAQQEKFFAAWYAHGDQDEMATQMLGHDAWQEAGWKYLAQHFASRQDFELASTTALRHLPPPVTAPAVSDRPLSALAGDFTLHPDDMAEGITLCQAQAAHHLTDEALATIAQLEKRAHCPRTVYYLQAQLCVKQRQWEDAWKALLQTGDIVPKT